jgi:hypothetical protein
MEAYFYLKYPEGNAVCHFMGEPTETATFWMKGEQAVIFIGDMVIHSALLSLPATTLLILFGVWQAKISITAIRISTNILNFK